MTEKEMAEVIKKHLKAMSAEISQKTNVFLDGYDEIVQSVYTHKLLEGFYPLSLWGEETLKKTNEKKQKKCKFFEENEIKFLEEAKKAEEIRYNSFKESNIIFLKKQIADVEKKLEKEILKKEEEGE